MAVTINSEVFIDFARQIEGYASIIDESARIAINDVARNRGLKKLQSDVYSQVAFPQGYLEAGRLSATKLASNDDLSAIITGRQRATSLARFVQGNPTPARGAKIPVMVKPGHPVTLKNAFFVRLRAGADLTETKFNMGLAIRLKDGESPHGFKAARAPIFESKNKKGEVSAVYLLYGPSVDQVFRTVADDDSDEIGEMVRAEFTRQLNLRDNS